MHWDTKNTFTVFISKPYSIETLSANGFFNLFVREDDKYVRHLGCFQTLDSAKQAADLHAEKQTGKLAPFERAINSKIANIKNILDDLVRAGQHALAEAAECREARVEAEKAVTKWSAEFSAAQKTIRELDEEYACLLVQHAALKDSQLGDFAAIEINALQKSVAALREEREVLLAKNADLAVRVKELDAKKAEPDPFNDLRTRLEALEAAADSRHRCCGGHVSPPEKD